MSLLQELHEGFNGLGITDEEFARFENETGLDLSDVLYFDKVRDAFCDWRDNGTPVPADIKGFLYTFATDIGKPEAWVARHTMHPYQYDIDIESSEALSHSEKMELLATAEAEYSLDEGQVVMTTTRATDRNGQEFWLEIYVKPLEVLPISCWYHVGDKYWLESEFLPNEEESRAIMDIYNGLGAEWIKNNRA